MFFTNKKVIGEEVQIEKDAKISCFLFLLSHVMIRSFAFLQNEVLGFFS